MLRPRQRGRGMDLKDNQWLGWGKKKEPVFQCFGCCAENLKRQFAGKCDAMQGVDSAMT